MAGRPQKRVENIANITQNISRQFPKGYYILFFILLFVLFFVMFWLCNFTKWKETFQIVVLSGFSLCVSDYMARKFFNI